MIVWSKMQAGKYCDKNSEWSKGNERGGTGIRNILIFTYIQLWDLTPEKK